MRSLLLTLLATLIVVTVMLPGTHPSVAASGSVSAETLRQMEAEFMKAAAERGSAGYMAYYADDSVELPNGADAIQGKLNIAKGMGFLDDKNNRLTWTPVGADSHPPGIWVIPTVLMSSAHSAKTASRLLSTVST